MKIMVEVNVFVMLRHFNQFGGLTGSVVEYVTNNIFGLYPSLSLSQHHISRPTPQAAEAGY
jgi:hypothetical protein